ncbi:MAG TPA: exo-alpha-sialidase [Verrucomicrobiales bacterium]|nr:exo-alpha-sialidase [Verrucomicrobiales bacterium]
MTNLAFTFVLTAACMSALHAEDVPIYSGPTPGTLREVSIPTVDISGDTKRQVVIARGTAEVYHGHCDTVLLPDGKTMFTAWTVNHARTIGPLARSDDAGLTWSTPLDVPANWHTTANTPAMHRLVDPQGRARLIVFADGLDWRRKGEPPYPMHQAVSEDDGKTWTPMKPNGIKGEVPPKTILSFDDGRRLVLWSDLPQFVVQSESRDGGLTWTPERRILKIPARWGQPAVTRSADGKTLLMLLRENSRKHHSLYSISLDEAKTWSEPLELPAALTGDRHVIKSTLDGRLVVAFRDMAKTSATYGHYIAWVGTFDDIVNRREGQYRIKLLHNASRSGSDTPGKGNTDCGYSDLELLPEGTVIATTYIKYADGPEKNSVVSTRFKLSETDSLLK